MLFGISGRGVMSFFSATDWMNRAIWSAPPPAPAMITKSIGFLGSHAWAAPLSTVVASAVAHIAPSVARLVVFIVGSSPRRIDFPCVRASRRARHS